MTKKGEKSFLECFDEELGKYSETVLPEQVIYEEERGKGSKEIGKFEITADGIFDLMQILHKSDPSKTLYDVICIDSEIVELSNGTENKPHIRVKVINKATNSKTFGIIEAPISSKQTNYAQAAETKAMRNAVAAQISTVFKRKFVKSIMGIKDDKFLVENGTQDMSKNKKKMTGSNKFELAVERIAELANEEDTVRLSAMKERIISFTLTPEKAKEIEPRNHANYWTEKDSDNLTSQIGDIILAKETISDKKTNNE